MITLTVLLLIGVLGLFWSLISFLAPVAWAGLKLIAFVIFLPFTILFMVMSGLFHLLMPILAIGLVVILITKALTAA